MANSKESLTPPGPAETAEGLAEAYGAMLGPHAPPPEEPARTPPPEEAAPPPLKRILEAILFVGVAPLTVQRACEAIRGLTPAQFAEILDELNRDYRTQGRPYRVRPRDQGYELALLPKYRGVLNRLYGSMREARLSPAALDVLSLVAYQQPAMRQEIESLRGAESGGPLRQLVRLGLVALQRGDADQRAVTYVTTARFLSLFGLHSLEDLPRTEELQRI